MAASLLSWLGVAEPTEGSSAVGKKAQGADGGRDAEDRWGDTTPHAHAGGLGPSGCALAFEATQRLLAVADTGGRVKVHGSHGRAALLAGGAGGATVDVAFMPAHACLLRLADVRNPIPSTIPQPVKPGPSSSCGMRNSADARARGCDVRLEPHACPSSCPPQAVKDDLWVLRVDGRRRVWWRRGRWTR